MTGTDTKHSLLRMLPGVDHILELIKADPFFQDIPKSVLVRSARTAIDSLRSDIIAGKADLSQTTLTDAAILESVRTLSQQMIQPNLMPVINATGVVIHTNLGRSILCQNALEQMSDIAGRYSCLEFNLSTGKRGSRHAIVEDILCELSGADAALVVNNNAGAVLLSLDTLARNKNVIISRGELVEIGGSFRIPDVMAKSGAILKEVGTTNRTHLTDYEGAITTETGLLLKVHQSNFSVEGFTAAVSLRQLVELGKKHEIPVMEDLGSGTFIDFSKYGLSKEPTVQESVQTGTDVVTFSGDKLLGGPQAGIIVGKRDVIDAIRKNPMARALRIDKLTLAALEATLMLYRDEQKAIEAIPTLRMMTLPVELLRKKATRLQKKLTALRQPHLSIRSMQLSSRVGGGALPLQDLQSVCLAVKVKTMSANAIEKFLRQNTPPIIGRIEEGFYIMDLRTIGMDEIPIIVNAFDCMLQRVES